MSLSPGTRLDEYEIQSPLGAGGMGEVYRARDTKLDRDVAIKVLPAHLTEDPAALARFEREAKAVAALSHPNILSIFHFGTSNGTTYAVTELLEGSTLGELLADGPLPVRKVTETGRCIAEGLAAAHQQGIFHRDLKPENVFVTPDGHVKILDFGLAKQAPPVPGPATEALTSGDDATRMHTHPQTDPGTVLGTVGYMSPEQVRAEPADHRSDIFSFGVLLYESLSGQRPFRGDSAVETLSAILREDPPSLADTNPAIPPALERVVRRCLEKQPEQRFQSARDLAFALDNAGSSGSVSTGTLPALESPPGPSPTRRLLVPLLTLVVGALLGLAAARLLLAPPSTQPVKISPLTFSGRDWAPDISPDGRMVAFTSDRTGTPRIWIKQLAGGGEQVLTDGPDDFARFSPDGSSVLFIRLIGNVPTLFRTALVGGQTRKMVDNVVSADWSPDGQRVALLRQAPSGFDSTRVLVADVQSGQAREIANLAWFLFSVRWSPDGSLLAASAQGASAQMAENNVVVLIDPETGAARTAFEPTGMGQVSEVAWVAPQRIVFAQASNLLGSLSDPADQVASVDLRTGERRTLFWVRNMFPSLSAYFATMAVAESGTFFFAEFPLRQNLWVGALDGSEMTPLTRGRSRDRQPAFSPDGDTVIFSSNRSGQLDLWTISVATGKVTQLTDDDAMDWDPAFTPDGRKILWSSSRSGNLEVWMANADGSAPVQVSRDGRDGENPTATADGEWIVYYTANPERMGIWKIRSDGTDAGRLVEGLGNIPDVSPDGRHASFIRWPGTGPVQIKVVELESGEHEVFATLPPPRRTGSVNLGRSRWMPDGRAIAFVGVDERDRTGIHVQDFVPGTDTSASRRKLAGFSGEYETESFGFSPDGKRLIISRQMESRNVMRVEGVPGVGPGS